jgi:hypothetical protein
MDTAQKLEILREVASDEGSFTQVLEKLLELTLSEHYRRLRRYEQELREFEARHGMDSATFYLRFEAGELGDAMDFCEWAGLIELRDDLQEKIRRLESARQ